ncbi:NAD-dependent epimerase/dehydratase family protein [Algoriphagus sediminis]|uniref:NAD-dependent epimerase/dehydratase family protein n=1 Tax=Algoriphagus sediminis TaxID=3057113 RepID=A0ABT7YEK7_9BACT|nr:NAD-dependent epimerase/dehydratase family protein [Algoriphagus sediminis]MDN3204965.1 NAD-dependent epimerase/dehydratase family protein [Algoriphagus sediminis]
MKKISIVGLGWLGKALAEKLSSEEYDVLGSTTTEEKAKSLSQEAYSVVTLKLAPHPTGKGFNKLFEVDTCVITIPPKTRSQSQEFYFQQLTFLKKLIDQSKVKRVIFISSSGVYPNEPREIPYDEEDEINPDNTGNPVILEAERIISERRLYELSIIRFGGLMGGGRILAKYFQGRENVDGEARVNYIHQTDAVNLCQWIIEQGHWEEVFNGVAPEHPNKKSIIEKNLKEFNFDPPKSYSELHHETFRLISSEKLIEMGFEFTYPDPLYFDYNS